MPKLTLAKASGVVMAALNGQIDFQKEIDKKIKSLYIHDCEQDLAYLLRFIIEGFLPAAI